MYIVSKDAFYGRKDFFPSITCEWSESDAFGENTIYTVSEFDALMESADREFIEKKTTILDKYGDQDAVWEKGTEEECHYFGYEKVRFSIDIRKGDATIHTTERQDVGDGDGSAIKFLSQFPSYHSEVGELRRQAGEELVQEVKRAGKRQRASREEVDEQKDGQPKARMPDRNAKRKGR